MRARIFIGCVSIFALIAAAPATATSDTDIPKGAQPLPGGGYALPLKAETPDWYTPELHRKVLAAGEVGRSVPIPKDVKVPQSGLAFTGIRPGSWMFSPAWCTMNFVFGSAPNYSIGSAGHCGSVGDEVVIIGAPGVLMNVGTITRSVDNGIGDDFSLTQIDAVWADSVNPSMAYWAGPTGTKSPAVGDPIVHAGHGLGIGTGGTPRAGVVTYGAGPGDAGQAYGWDGAATPGDSGSGVRHATGPAVGNLTHLVVGTQYAPAFIAGTTMQRILAIAGQPLATATLVPDPLP
jgi:hypothetical protein